MQVRNLFSNDIKYLLRQQPFFLFISFLSQFFSLFLSCHELLVDFHGPKDWSKFPPRSTHICAEPETLTSLYHKQLQVPGYKSLLQKDITIFGTYDGKKMQQTAMGSSLLLFLRCCDVANLLNL